ncbi:MAG: ABC transporter permease, partial [Spirochaetota bacterium]
MIQYGWYAVFLRQMLLFRKKILKMGYVFSAMMMPVVYLVAFGFGLRGSVQIHGIDYLSFLVPGLAAMSSMNNSYNWTASSLTMNRLYFKNFQIFIQAPISPASILAGEIMAGMVKGLFASLFIIAIGLVFAADFHISWPFLTALMINTFLFASLGVLIGMIAK